jgi:hypothetical protein
MYIYVVSLKQWTETGGTGWAGVSVRRTVGVVPGPVTAGVITPHRHTEEKIVPDLGSKRNPAMRIRAQVNTYCEDPCSGKYILCITSHKIKLELAHPNMV